MWKKNWPKKPKIYKMPSKKLKVCKSKSMKTKKTMIIFQDSSINSKKNLKILKNNLLKKTNLLNNMSKVHKIYRLNSKNSC